MKKFALIILTAALASASAAAQSQNIDKHWYIGAGVGINVGIDGQKYVSRVQSHIGGGDAVDVYLGRFWGKVGGFRAGYQGLKISNQYTDYNKTNFSYFHADLMARLADAFVPYLHAGYAHIDKGSPAAGVGVMLPIRLFKQLYIIPDGKLTFLNSNAFSGIGAGLGANLSATMGLRLTLEGEDPAHKAARQARHAEKAAAAAAALATARAAMARQEAEAAAAKAAAEKAEAEAAADAAEKAAAEAAEKAAAEKPAESTAQPAVQPTTQPAVQPAAEPATVPAAEPAKPVELMREVVYFDTNIYTIDAKAAKTLDKVAAFMKKHPGAKAYIDGHTDSTGTEGWNSTLSGHRAVAVLDYLIGKGISTSSFVFAGFGETRPAHSNSSKEGRARNRRVEICIAE